MKELSQSVEDYLETIYVLSLHRKAVRVSEIARKLKVRIASVTGMLKNLADKGYVRHERYGSVELTQKGEKIAKSVYRRHTILRIFLTEILLVEPERAEIDACRLEHYLSPETFEKFVKFIEFVQTCPVKEPVWLSGLHEYLKEGKRPDCIIKEDTKKSDKTFKIQD
ncbi:MAG TPA: metal-dependent transcriptional regulator [Deltaproteobacteria bacterium]|nr:metal-dependent transcriptional regulator [Deltaproteobacteria bacterium]